MCQEPTATSCSPRNWATRLRTLLSLLGVDSLLARIPQAERAWALRAMALPFLFRPGAGRLDAAREQLMAPILSFAWDGRPQLRLNASDYTSLRDGSHILRVTPLPAQWYRTPEQVEMAGRLPSMLRELLHDVDGIARTAATVDAAAPEALSLATGDLLAMSNRAAAHGRSTFEGPRYLQRLYPDAAALRLWQAGWMNAGSEDERCVLLAAQVASEFSSEQLAHLERYTGALPPRSPARPARRTRRSTRPLRSRSPLLRLPSTKPRTCSWSAGGGWPGSPAAAPALARIIDPLAALHRRLSLLRSGQLGDSWRLLSREALRPVDACSIALEPLAFNNLSEDNLAEWLASVRSAATAPDAVDRLLGAVGAAMAVVRSCSTLLNGLIFLLALHSVFVIPSHLNALALLLSRVSQLKRVPGSTGRQVMPAERGTWLQNEQASRMATALPAVRERRQASRSTE